MFFALPQGRDEKEKTIQSSRIQIQCSSSNLQSHSCASGAQPGARVGGGSSVAGFQTLEPCGGDDLRALESCFWSNDLCDALQMNSGPLSAIRGATYPSRNGLSHANKIRTATLAERLFWKLLDRLQRQHPGFGRTPQAKRFAWRFHKSIQIADATTLQLVAHCMDWAKHRRRKAAAQGHMRLDLESFLPRFVLVAIQVGRPFHTALDHTSSSPVATVALD
jgi:hypothetical protein